MHGSLSLHDGVLWVGRHEKTAHVAAFDLDGRRLGRGFSFCDSGPAGSAVSGLVVDRDHRIWVADTPAGELRAFNLFGMQVAGFGGGDPREDFAKLLTSPVDVDLLDNGDDGQLVVVSGGRRRHAVRLFEADGRLILSLRPLGDPRGEFRGVSAVASSGSHILVSEAGRERIQVFREGDFHFAFHPIAPGFGRRPSAVARLKDGRLIVAVTGEADKEESGILLFDSTGHLRSVLARPGSEPGQVSEPHGLTLLDAGRDRESRLFVIDRDGERVQVFNLEGDCYGAFESLVC